MSRRINISENQLSLPFRQVRVGVISYDQRVRFFWILAGILIISLGAYIYAMHTTARNIAMRQDLEQQIAEVSVDLDALEFAYIELKNDITLELAYFYGFKEVKNPMFVSRVRGASLSFNTLDQ